MTDNRKNKAAGKLTCSKMERRGVAAVQVPAVHDVGMEADNLAYELQVPGLGRFQQLVLDVDAAVGRLLSQQLRHRLRRQLCRRVPLVATLIHYSVPHPDPESGAFLSPGSGMGKKSGSGSGMGKNPDHIASLETIFGRIRDGKKSDPGSGKTSRISNIDAILA
jgi:hypothetical protein